MKTNVDRETCTGCGLCLEVCPEVFQLDDDNIATVKVDVVPVNAEDTCREAAESCPVDAISVED